MGEKVIDIGSGSGDWAPMLRSAGARHLIAIEPSERASLAATVFDEVYRGVAEEAPASLFAGVSLLIVADVFEHVVDPWSLMAHLRNQVVSGTRLAVSMPNAQNLKYGLSLLLKGNFDYTDEGGWLDRGHLRWFTARTLRSSLESAGWHVTKEGGHVLPGRSTLLYRATAGRARHLAFHQLHMLAEAV